MSTLSATIRGNPVSVLLSSLPSWDDTAETRSVLTFTVIDTPGTAHFYRGDPVVLSDSVSGTLYTGYVQHDDPHKQSPDPTSTTILHAITCMDNQYKLDKRTNNQNYLNWYAGDIALDMMNRIGIPEGVMVAGALRADDDQTDFAQGILTGVQATLNVPGGDLELVQAGTNVTISELTQSNFATGTLTNVTATSAGLQIVSSPALELSATGLSGSGVCFIYLQIWSGSYTVASNDTLNYEMWLGTGSQTAGVDLIFSDGTVLKGTGCVDQTSLSADVGTDLTGVATSFWYSRSISLSTLSGKTLTGVCLAYDNASSGASIAYFRNIYLGSQSGSPFFNGTLQQNPPSIYKLNNFGVNAPVTVVTGYGIASTTATTPTYVRYSTAYSIDAAKVLGSSLLLWTTNTLSGVELDISVSFDGGITFVPCINNAALVGMAAGASIAGLSLIFREELKITGTDPTITPLLVTLTATLSSAHVTSTPTSLVKTYSTSTDWNTGTFSNAQAVSCPWNLASSMLTLNGAIRTWGEGTLANQTTFNTSGTSGAVALRGHSLHLTGGSAGGSNTKGIISELNFAGNYANFIANFDVLSEDPANTLSLAWGFIYRTTYWAATDATYAYIIYLTYQSTPNFSVTIAKGSNSSSGSFTALHSTFPTGFSAGNHRVQIVVNGSTHQCYVDGILCLTYTDSSFTGSGGVGMWVDGGSGYPIMGAFQNFGIAASTLGTWTSPSTSLASVGSYGSSSVAWRQDVTSTDAVVTVQTSIDGGSTWHTITNGGAIVGLTAGQSLSGVSVQVKITLQTGMITSLPEVAGLRITVTSSYGTITGTRSTAPLGNDTAVRANQSGFGTTTDGQTYTKTGTGTDAVSSNELTITNTTGDVHEQLGTRTGTDEDSTVRLAVSASTITAGMELRYGSSSNYYRLSMSTTAIVLSKNVSGTTTTLATTSQTQSTATYYSMRFRVQGTNLYGRVWASGTLEPTTWQITATDSSLASGGFALYASGTGTASFDHYRVTQYPDPSISLAPVLPRVGSSLVAWNATTPTNTTLSVQTSLDGVTWTSATNGSAVPGLTVQPSPTIDLFTTNTSANYTNTSITGGSTATETYDTTNSRITITGGSGALYLNSSTTVTDVDVFCDMDESDAGGLVWRYVDASDYYELGCYDDSSSSGFTNQLRLYKVASGTRSLLGTASTITWHRSTSGFSPYKRIRVTMLGSVISVYFDGTLMQTYTDGSPLGSGLVGLRNDGGTSRYYQLRIQPQGSYVSGTPQGDTVTGEFLYTLTTQTTTDPTVTPQLTDLNTSVRSPSIATGALIPQLHPTTAPFAEFVNKELDTVATASGDYSWNIDQNSAFSFGERHANPAPWCLASQDLIYSQTTGVGSGVAASLGGAAVTPSATADLYVNRVQITNCIGVTAQQHEQKIADGSTSSWTMAYPLYSAPTISVGGIAQTVGVQGVDTGKQFYWQAASNSIGQDTSATKIAAGVVLDIYYVGQFTQTVQCDNTAEQAARALIEGGTGIVETIIDKPGMLASNATTYGNGYLARFDTNNAVQLQAITQRSGLTSGMMLSVFLPEHALINTQMLVTSIQKIAEQQADGTTIYFYQVTATQGANLQNWVKVFGF